MELLESLNPAQREAACAPDGPLLILAGAGSGKTRVLACRIAWLLGERQVPPWAFAGVTFTNKAAAELRARVGVATGVDARRLSVATFHSLGVRLLREFGAAIGLPPGFTILDDDDALSVARDALKDTGRTGDVPPAALLKLISLAKAEDRSPDDLAASAADARSEIVAAAYRRYEARLREAAATDFDDLIRLPIRLLATDEAARTAVHDRFRHVLVDEYQDTSPAQYRFLRAITGPHRNVTCVGDPDQSIYGWRGADIRNILEFERDFPDAKVVALERNYRSTPRILAAAGAVIAHNLRRKPKKLWTEGPPGPPVAVLEAMDETEEAGWIVTALGRHLERGETPGDLAVLYRTHAQSRPLEEALVRAGIPYALLGGVKFYARREVKDVLAWARLWINPADTVSFGRALAAPPRGIGETTLDKLTAAAVGRPVLDHLRADATQDALPARARGAAREFLAVLDRGSEALAEEGIAAALAVILEESGYLPWLDEKHPQDAMERRENLRELLAAAQAADEAGVTLDGFLENAALMSELDRRGDLPDRVVLMTLHNAKGLEFGHVTITGLEDGLLPHASSRGDLEELEEERRLFYVGLTRAKRSVVLTHARGRKSWNEFHWMRPSPFLDELPAEHVARLYGPDALPLPDDWAPPAVTAPVTSAEPELTRVPVEEEWREERPLRNGEEVVHPRFGHGRVLRVEGRGADARITVGFPRAGTKTLVAGLSRLRRADEVAA